MKNKKYFFLILLLFTVFSVFLIPQISPVPRWGDSSELATVVKILGIAHPPGYPLYILLGWFFCKIIPRGSWAWKLGFFSFLSTISAAIILLFSLKLLLIKIYPSEKKPGLKEYVVFLSILVLISISLIREQAINIEVYAFSGLLIALFLSFSIYWWFSYQKKFFFLASLFFCLAVIHHPTLIFFSPLLLINFAPFFWQAKAKDWLIMLILVILSGSIYWYLPIRARANPLINWGNPVNFENFLWCITGGEFSERMAWMLNFWGAEKAFNFWSNLKKISIDLAISLGPIILLAFVGIKTLWKKEAGLCLGLGMCILLLISFVAFYPVGDKVVFMYPIYFPLIIFISIGIYELLSFISGLKIENLFKALFLLVIIYPATLPLELGSKNGAWNYGHSVLQNVPKDTLLLANGDNQLFPLWYQQMVENRRPDVTVVAINMLASPWYKDMLEKQDLEINFRTSPFLTRGQWVEAIRREVILPNINSRPICILEYIPELDNYFWQKQIFYHPIKEPELPKYYLPYLPTGKVYRIYAGQP